MLIAEVSLILGPSRPIKVTRQQREGQMHVIEVGRYEQGANRTSPHRLHRKNLTRDVNLRQAGGTATLGKLTITARCRMHP